MDIERKTEKYFSISGCHELAISVVINLPEASCLPAYFAHKSTFIENCSQIYLSNLSASLLAEIIHPRW